MASAVSPGHRGIAWSFVALQAMLLVVMVVAPGAEHWSPVPAVTAVGRSLEVLGLWAALALGWGLTPSPLPNGRTGLVSRGPYRWMRHPMYTAVMMFMAGVAILSRSWLVVAALAMLIGLFHVKARWEEERLVEALPGYGDYRVTTARFIPVPRTRRARPDRAARRRLLR